MQAKPFLMPTDQDSGGWLPMFWILGNSVGGLWGKAVRVEVLLPIELRQDVQDMLTRAHAQYL